MRQIWKRASWTIAIVLIALAVLSGLVYHYLASGGMVARQKPTRLETFLAQGLVDLSIPKAAKVQPNPLQLTEANVAAGSRLYQAHCEVCHGFDGKGHTTAGAGMYPPPLDLGRIALKERNRTDGDLFYFIRNGIRNTAMPGWQLPDNQTWQLVVYLRNLPFTAAQAQTALVNTEQFPTNAQYVGSASCRDCHASIFASWKKTLMANVVRDPRQHPEAFIPDFSKSDPLLTFTTNDIAFVYGQKWKQRYFKRTGDDYYPMPAQWDVAHKIWRPYFVKDDWWAPFYPPDNFKRPTSALCDGCHSVNFNTATHTVTEWNVGCESCHGPGSEHVKHAVSANIVNPARLDYVQASDVCIQCHSQGRPLNNPIEGKYYDWPVGFQMGRKLADFWKLEDHKLGETTFTHFADGTAHKNRMQGNDYITSQMYSHGVACYTCHDAHGTANDALLRKPASQLCLDCHGPGSPNGPRDPSISRHTHHPAGTTGSECIACHMPKIAQTLADSNVRSHTFRFVGPAQTDALKIPNACNVCHTDKTTAWTKQTLAAWSDRSPWRMQN